MFDESKILSGHKEMLEGEIFPKMEPHLKERWLKALRSGRYKQGRTYLKTKRNGEAKFCCLGVLCDLINPGNWSEKYFDPIYTAEPVRLPGEEFCDERGFKSTTGLTLNVREEVAKLDVTATGLLMDMNDHKKFSFIQIANWIENNL